MLSILMFGAALMGCTPSEVKTFEYGPSSSKPTLMRNGDTLYDLVASGDFYDSTRLMNSGEAVDRLNEGEDVLLLWHQKSCSHCKVLQEVFSPYVMDSHALVYSLDQTNIRDEVNALKEAFPDMANDFPTLATPYLFYLSASTKRATRIDFTGQTSTVKAFESFMDGQLNLENVYTFRSLDNFKSFCDSRDCLGYVSAGTSLDGYFRSDLYPVARKSSKVTAVLEYAYMGQADQAQFASEFGEAEAKLIDYTKEKPSAVTLSEGASDLLKTYYGA